MPYATEENLTDLAMDRWQKCKSPRLRQIMTSLVKHLHGFVREVELSEEEWAFAVNWLARTGRLCDEKRQEFILFSDVLGISMLVDAINHRLPSEATPSTVLGPFQSNTCIYCRLDAIALKNIETINYILYRNSFFTLLVRLTFVTS